MAITADNKKRNGTDCTECSNYFYDDESGCWCCLVDLDEDEMYRFITGTNRGCPYFDPSDDYFLSRKQ